MTHEIPVSVFAFLADLRLFGAVLVLTALCFMVAIIGAILFMFRTA